MINSPTSSFSLHDELTADFKLGKFDDFQKFFVPSTVRGFSRIAAEIAAFVNQIVQLIFKGNWINASEVGKKINEYRFTQVFSEEEEKLLKADFTRLLGEGKYDDFFEEAMKESWYDKISNSFSFFANFIRHPLETGAVLPSSEFLAKKVSAHVTPSHSTESPKHFLEVGAGTGEFTYQIIRNLGENDKFDIVEFDEKFCNILRRRFGHLKNVTVNCQSITDWKTDGYRYDTIVSGLPLNAFSPEMVASVYQKFEELIEDEGHLSYFEYPFISDLKKSFLSKSEVQKLEDVFKIKEAFRKKHQVSSDIEWLNVPPAKAIHCKVTKAS